MDEVDGTRHYWDAWGWEPDGAQGETHVGEGSGNGTGSGDAARDAICKITPQVGGTGKRNGRCAWGMHLLMHTVATMLSRCFVWLCLLHGVCLLLWRSSILNEGAWARSVGQVTRGCMAESHSVLVSGRALIVGVRASVYVWAVCVHSLGAACMLRATCLGIVCARIHLTSRCVCPCSCMRMCPLAGVRADGPMGSR